MHFTPPIRRALGPMTTAAQAAPLLFLVVLIASLGDIQQRRPLLFIHGADAVTIDGAVYGPGTTITVENGRFNDGTAVAADDGDDGSPLTFQGFGPSTSIVLRDSVLENGVSFVDSAFVGPGIVVLLDNCTIRGAGVAFKRANVTDGARVVLRNVTVANSVINSGSVAFTSVAWRRGARLVVDRSVFRTHAAGGWASTLSLATRRSR